MHIRVQLRPARAAEDHHPCNHRRGQLNDMLLYGLKSSLADLSGCREATVDFLSVFNPQQCDFLDAACTLVPASSTAKWCGTISNMALEPKWLRVSPVTFSALLPNTQYQRGNRHLNVMQAKCERVDFFPLSHISLASHLREKNSTLSHFACITFKCRFPL